MEEGVNAAGSGVVECSRRNAVEKHEIDFTESLIRHARKYPAPRMQSVILWKKRLLSRTFNVYESRLDWNLLLLV